MAEPGEVESGFASVRGIQLYFERKGSGPRVLMINGTGGDLRVKPNIFDAGLPGEFELLGFDQRGLGQTHVPDGPYTMADYADDAAALLDHVGWEETAVVGVSFGGMVAQELTLRHPGRVTRLVLCCTSSGGAGGSSYPLHELQSLAVEERTLAGISIADSRYDEQWVAANQETVDLIVAGSVAREAALEELARRGQILQLDARRGHDTWDRLTQISCPTLICAGRYDNLAPLANSERLATAIPESELQIFEGGHIFLMQDPAALPAISKFLLA